MESYKLGSWLPNLKISPTANVTNNLRKSLTLATCLLFVTVGLGTYAVALVPQTAPKPIQQSDLDAAPRQNSNQEQLLMTSYRATVTATDSLTIRSGPGKQFRAIGNIESGQAVEVLRRNDAPMNSEAWHWVYIRPIRSRVEGWASSRFIGPGSVCQGIGG